MKNFRNCIIKEIQKEKKIFITILSKDWQEGSTWEESRWHIVGKIFWNDGQNEGKKAFRAMW